MKLNKYHFEFPNGADCMGYIIHSDQVLADSEKKARKIVRRAYGCITIKLAKTEEVELDIPEGNPPKRDTRIMFGNLQEHQEDQEDQELNLNSSSSVEPEPLPGWNSDS